MKHIQHTLQSRLEESFSRFKERIALEAKDIRLSYSQLDQRSHYIAHWIRSQGMEKGTFIGILLDNRSDLILTIIGVIKAGCVFIPLDPAYPDKRIKAMIRTCNIGVVIIDSTNYQRFVTEDSHSAGIGEGQFILMDEMFSRGETRWFDEKPQIEYSAEDKIYVYFTSGTTGVPKAILGKNGSLLHFINWEIDCFGIDEAFRFSQFTTPGFDVFLRDILVPLCAGAVICIPDYQEVLLNGDRLVPWIAANRITLIHCVPSLFRLFNNHPLTGREIFRHLRYILFAGERVNPLDLKKWYEKTGEHTQLVNLYGPTETTLAKVFYLINPWDADKKIIPIGKAIDGARVIILDQDLDICDELEVGELYIRTPYRSFGYYNDPALNAERFIANPFVSDPGDIIYKTGDLGRMLPDGNIELVGRLDRQVKIRGRRIELEEIETVLQRFPGVKEAAVIKKEGENNNITLHAFAALKGGDVNGNETFTADLKHYLSGELPDYMIPASIRILEKIPRKPNLKIDFDELSEMLKEKEENECIAPRNPLEKRLVETWSELLGIAEDQLSITSTFFEVGGNSLNLMTLISRIHRIFDVKISLEQIFKNSTIEKQAAYIKQTQREQYIPLESVEKRDYYALSSAQKRLYVLNQMEPASTRYNMPTVLEMRGEFVKGRFENGVRQLIRRHESLRTSFHMVENQPVQRILEEVKFEVEYEDALDKDLSALVESFIHSFDLSVPPLLRVGIISLAENRHIFIYDMHHIITDGISQGLLGNDFLALYAGVELPSLRIQYRDYSQWQNQTRQKESLQQQEAYWLSELGNEIPVLNLPTDFMRPAELGFAGGTVSFTVDSREIQNLRQLALDESVTLYMVFLTIYFLFLGRISRQEEIVLGTPTAGRIHEDLENVMGMFVNTLVLKSSPRGEGTIAEFLQEIKEKTLKAFENQEFQFEDLVDGLSLPRDVSRNPIFDVVFVYHDINTMTGHSEHREMAGLGLSPWDYRENTSKFDLTIRIIEQGESLDFQWEYSTQLFREDTIERFAIYFKNVTASVLQNMNQRIGEMEIISAEEKQQMLADWNEAPVSFPIHRTIHQLFGGQVERVPDHIALVGPMLQTAGHLNGNCTYSELDLRSDRLAGRLREKGVRPDTLVAIMVERSVEMIVGMLGILKSGGAYLPIDPEYPEERREYMLADSSVRVLVTIRLFDREVKKFRHLEVKKNLEIILIDSIEVPVFSSSNPFKFPTTLPTSLAYVIYTSGTTGKPKGMLIQHGNVVRLMVNDRFQFDFRETDIWTLFHSSCFDFSVWEMYGALLYGGRLIIVTRMTARDPGKYLEILRKEQVTVLNQTPAAFYNLAGVELTQHGADSPLKLRYVIFGGEALSPAKLKDWREKYPETRLINMFGITETTVHVTYKEISEREIGSNTSNIGKAIPTLVVYITDSYLNLQPIGIAGEILVGGAGIGRGYLNRTELTWEKFINYKLQNTNYKQSTKYKSQITNKDASKAVSSNLAEQHNEKFLRGSRGRFFQKEPPGGRRNIYKSGDLGRWLKGGDLEYLGRIDRQVKIRGFRIELAEIENCLIGYDGIKEVLLQVREHSNRDKYLCAYIVPYGIDSKDQDEASGRIKLSQLREYLSRALPDYMIPAYFVIIEGLPLTPNGKIDHNALPEPGGSGLGSDTRYAAPRNSLERALVEIWQQVLGRQSIGINDNFFEMGGDSIKTIQIASRLNKLGYKLELRDIFLKPRISELAAAVKQIEQIAEQSAIMGTVPLTPIQEWFFENSPTHNHHFNQAVIIDVDREFTPEAVKAVFSKIQEHHDVLRMTFREVDGEIIQTNHGLEYPLSLSVHDLRGQANARQVLEEKAEEIQGAIDLATGPLLRLGLFHLDESTRLLIVIHHLAVDGVSWRILFEDIDSLYRNYKEGEPLALPLKTDPYKLWAEKLVEFSRSKQLLKEMEYWASVESTNLEPLETDLSEHHNYVKDVETMSFCLSEEQTGQLLTVVNDAFFTEINDILLTALGIGIRETWGQQRCLIALEGHGREEILTDININRTMGWFTTVYPVILEMSYTDDLSRQVKEVKEILRRVPNKGIGYGILKYLTPAELKEKQGMVFQLCPQVSFNYLGQFNTQEGETFSRITYEGVGTNQSPDMQRKYQLDVVGMVTSQQLEMAIVFNRKHYRKQTIERLLSHFNEALTRIISLCTSNRKREHTPSDFTYNQLSIETVDRLSAEYGNSIDDICKLTPMQEGMLFHTLYNEGSSTYFEQMSFCLHGNLDVEIVKKSFARLFQRYDVLRTAFIHTGKDIDRSIQLLLKQRQPEFLYEDLRLPEEEKGNQNGELYIEEFKDGDRYRSFDLSRDILMRLAVFQAEDNRYEFIWSHHHILMDGWCTGIIVRDFFEIYNSHLENRAPRLPEIQPFRVYLRWLEKQDKEESRKYWEHYLNGYEQLAEVPKINGVEAEAGEYKNESLSFRLDRQETRRLNELAGRSQVTLNTVIQAIWGLVLATYNGVRDVVYGTVVSGRPSEIEGVESMVGLFINTIPVRVCYDEQTTFSQLLRQIQESAIDSDPFHYYPLAEIQAVHPLKQNLLDHILIFENYPVIEQIQGVISGSSENPRRPQWELSDIDRFEQSNYDFNLVLAPGEQLQVVFSYNAHVYEAAFIRIIFSHLKSVLEQVLTHPEDPVGGITLLSEAEKQQILFEFNDTDRGYLPDLTIHRLFEEQAARTPENTALCINLDFSDLLTGLPRGEINESAYDRYAGCCFKKNPFVFRFKNNILLKALPGIDGVDSEEKDSGKLILLETQKGNYTAVNKEVLLLLDYFDGSVNLQSIFRGITGEAPEFLVTNFMRKDGAGISLDKRERIVMNRQFSGFVRLIHLLYHANLIFLQNFHSNLTPLTVDLSIKEEDEDAAFYLEEQVPLPAEGKNVTVLLLGDTVGTATSGLLYLASYLRRHGIDAYCQLNDLSSGKGLLKENIRVLLEKFQPQVVGVSMKWFPHIARVLEICKAIKSYNPSIKVVIGGNTASFYSDNLIQYEEIDYVISGDGELPLLKICLGEDDIPNCTYKKENRVIVNPITYVQDSKNSADIYISHFHEIFIAPENPYLGESIYISTGKGCSQQCFYCAGCLDVQKRTFNRPKPFLRGVDEVRKDIIAVKDQVSTLMFDFDLFLHDAIDYYEGIWTGIDLTRNFCIYFSWKLPTPEFLALMTKTFNYLYLMIDICSLSQGHRRKLEDKGLIKKQPTDEELFAFFDECEQYANVKVTVNQIAGLPYFSGEDMRESEEVFSRLIARYSCFGGMDWGRLHAQPGAPLVENCETYDMYSYATTFADFLYYSELNFQEEEYPNLATAHYPYIYSQDSGWNSRISKYYLETTKKMMENEKRKQETVTAATGISYGDLDKKANQFAWRLRKAGVKRDTIVGLMAKSSIEMAAAILGILKSGAVFLPISPDYPGERVKYMLENSGVEVLITDDHHKGDFYIHLPRLNRINVNDRTLASEESTNPGNAVDPADIAYVIYTSGTTGKPKGVAVEHGSAVNTLTCRKEHYRMTLEDVSLQLFPNTFDGFITSFFTPVISGATVVLVKEDEIIDLTRLKDIIVKNRVTHFIVVPPLFQEMVDMFQPEDMAGLKVVTLAGDTVHPGLLAKAAGKNKKLEIVNEYGVTEAAVMSTIYWDRKRTKPAVKIGKPIRNTRLYITDSSSRLVPVGVPGELCIAGAGTARGYLNNPELTSEKFRTDTNKKFLRGVQGGSFYKKRPPGRRRQKHYHTGDLARWDWEGNIEFLGRIDHQLKIRGYRIEPGEIENQLLTHSRIRAAVVLPGKTGSGGKEESLCAYIVTDQELKVPELKEHLSGRLPEYMIPSDYIRIAKIPLTPIGKIDRKSLDGHGTAVGTGVEYVAPANELEQVIADAWKTVLQLDRVGIYDNFFDIGGDSIKAIRLNNRLNEALNKKFSIVVLFEYVTIHSFIRYIKNEESSGGSVPRRGDRSEVIDEVKRTRAERRIKRRG